MDYDADLMHPSFTCLTVTAIDGNKVYLDGGIPLVDQTRPVSLGDEIIVCVFNDFTGNQAASMKLDEFVDPDPAGLYPDKRVNLWIYEETDLGFKALIDGKQMGVLYHNQVFQKIGYASLVVGFVNKVREDGKVDLRLQPAGIQGSADVGRRILNKLRENGGFLALTEKSEPNVIYDMFGVSKKKFKMALGGIYKQQLVSLEEDGIRLQR